MAKNATCQPECAKETRQGLGLVRVPKVVNFLVNEIMNRSVARNNAQCQYIYDPFEDWVNRTPGAVAVVFEGQQVTYSELGDRADGLARCLQRAGAGPETRLGIYVCRSWETIVGILGILKAGAAYVPLDPLSPAFRLDSICQDADLKIVLTARPSDEPHDSWLNRDKHPDLITIGADACSGSHLDHLFGPNHPVGNSLAYILYTSGSTGAPKGVMIEHRNVLALLHAFEQVAPSGAKLAGTSVCPFGFDVSVWEIFSTLCFGGTLHILTPDTFADPQRFAHYLIDHSVTSAYIPPALLPGIIGEFESHQGPIALDRILVGVEPIKQGLLQRFRDRLGPIRIVNGYGPTEATICSTFFSFQTASDVERRTPIGTAVSGYQVYIVNQDLEPVPPGETGEVLVGGAGVGRGYLHRPELTAEKFIPNPFTPLYLPPPAGGEQAEETRLPATTDTGGSSRLYRTGDLAYYLPDGNIEFVGRADHQVKIHGFRVEPGEIEAVLSQHPAVARCVVLARKDTPGDPSLAGGAGKRLVAYVVPAESHPPAENEVRSFLKAKLPGYMLPSAFVFLQSMPLTPNGKVDWQALPTPDTDKPQSETRFRTPIEEILAEIWRQVLGLESIDIQDNFFDLGGHSLLATQVISRARQALQAELSLRDLFDSPTLAELAKLVGSAHKPQLPPLAPTSRSQTLPLFFAQQRLWLLSQLQPDSPTYNIPIAYRLMGTLDRAALDKSLNEIVQRHETLRTNFAVAGEQPVQVIAPTMTLALPIVDLRELPEAERETESQQLAAAEARRPFNLTHHPLVRSVLLQLGDEEHVLILTMHHIISDDWSMGIFNRELAALYESCLSGQPSPLSKLPLQYADFAHWQRQWLQGKALETLLAYWKEQLGNGLPLLELPTDRPRPAVQTFRGAHYSMMVSQAILESLKALSRQEGATLFMTLLAAFQVLLYRYTGQKDIVVGSPIANRNQAEIEGLIGFFVNTLVLRANLGGNLTFRELLGRVREVTLAAFAHQDLPFEKLVQALQMERHLSYNPLFQVAFALQTAALGTLTLPGLTTSLQVLDNGTAKFDLTLELWEELEGLCGQWEYSTDLFDVATVGRMAGHFQTLLENIASDPNQRISELALLTQEECHRLLAVWNDTLVEFPQDQCAHQWVETWGYKTPDAIAVTMEGQHLTYGELNNRANQLARHLQNLGVGPEIFVGLYMGRSPEMITGILGTLKAGGVYVPLDSIYPKERLVFMLEDVRATVALTQQSLAGDLAECATQVICLDKDWGLIAQESKKPVSSTVTANNLAYVIYTSGSTGRPKGVQIEHRGLLNLIAWHQRAFAVSQVDRATQVASPAFDASVWEAWPYLAAGASIHLVDEATRASPAQIVEWIVSEKITISFLPTPLAESVLALEWPRDTALRILLTGGDKLYRYPSPTLPFDLVNNYGPTESAVVAASGLIPARDQADRAPHIGRPIANTCVYILDSHLHPVPVGVPGELYIGSAGLARGYLNRPELTAESFIPNPFGSEPTACQLALAGSTDNSRLYKTGDLARYLPDGAIEFLGRVDHQVKVRGFRVELGEIETILSQHTDVREALVLAQDSPTGKRIVAYVIPKNKHIANSELRRFLKEKLPEYMLPAAFVNLEAFPLTPNGKVDRQALMALCVAGLETKSPFAAPRTPAEKQLVGIWSQLLGLEQVSIHDNFFDLGGHSLLATRLLSRVCETFQVELSLRSLFEAPTVADLAMAITQAQAEQVNSAEVARMLQELENLSEEKAREILKG